MHFKIAITKMFFISASINSVKDKTINNNNDNNNKSLMYGPMILKYSLNLQQINHYIHRSQIHYQIHCQIHCQIHQMSFVLHHL